MTAKATFFSLAQRPPLSPVPSTSSLLISKESPICEDYSPGLTPPGSPSFQEAYDQDLCPVSGGHWFVACCCWAWLGTLFPCFFTAISGACSNRTGPPLPSACENTTATLIELSTAAQATSYGSSLPQNDDLSGPDLPPVTMAPPQNSISTLVLCSPASAPQPPSSHLLGLPIPRPWDRPSWAGPRPYQGTVGGPCPLVPSLGPH